ncbi:MAG: pseudaminic acid biosynthesis-associated methylase [Synergistaceae bacterium]|jgi:spore coat polysaccharide biosynthesis protein SpsF|nr:pseudaminic acid biosynthesis-associated methylase [Synergistaceae bacterium]
MSAYKPQQEEFWSQAFGDEYIDRNSGQDLVSKNLPFWSEILRKTGRVGSILELGANIGVNLRAISALASEVELGAVEINKKAADILKSWGGADVFHESILDFKPSREWDLVFTKGVLIHINPDELPSVYDLIIGASSRYVMVCEYYNPKPVEIVYRENEGFLFKRDFAGEIMDRAGNLRLVDYGFIYHRDPWFPQDDCTWFLMEKMQAEGRRCYIAIPGPHRANCKCD